MKKIQFKKLKVGDLVTVKRNIQREVDDSNMLFTDEMKKYVGTKLKVVEKVNRFGEKVLKVAENDFGWTRRMLTNEVVRIFE